MPMQPCRKAGCNNLVRNGYCVACQPRFSPAVQAESVRESAHRRGYGRRWQKTSAGFLRCNPICSNSLHLHDERDEPATVTDHIIPHRGDMNLFWDSKNWQPLCKRCHDHKTAIEDGGFGNRRAFKQGDVNKNGAATQIY